MGEDVWHGQRTLKKPSCVAGMACAWARAVRDEIEGSRGPDHIGLVDNRKEFWLCQERIEVIRGFEQRSGVTTYI